MQDNNSTLNELKKNYYDIGCSKRGTYSTKDKIPIRISDEGLKEITDKADTPGKLIVLQIIDDLIKSSVKIKGSTEDDNRGREGIESSSLFITNCKIFKGEKIFSYKVFLRTRKAKDDIDKLYFLSLENE